MGLTVDFSMGFVCFDAASKVGVGLSFIANKKIRKNRSFLQENTDNCVKQSDET